MVIIANKWKQLLVQRQFLLAPVPIKNSILSIAKSPNLQKTLDFPAGSQYSRRGDEWINFLHLGVLLLSLVKTPSSLISLAFSGSVAKIHWPHKMLWRLLVRHHYGM